MNHTNNKEEIKDYEAYKSNVPSAFITGLSYTANWNNGATTPGKTHIIGSAQDTNIQEDTNASFVEISEAYNIAEKHLSKSARECAFAQQKHNVSRRLLLAERSKKLTVTCPVTGIVSLLEIPQIPFPASNKELQKALIWSSPFASNDNCRGIAQQGISYLRRLDTQVLAGVLIVLSSQYELFHFQPFDSGAQRNAILRTAGKDYIIDAIIMIESLIHSANYKFLPKLSLIFDSELEEKGLAGRMKSYLNILAAALAKPDKEAYDDKKIMSLYPIRPVYIKDAETGKKKISFLAKQEQARAKREFAKDKKAGKIAISQLCKQASVPDKFKNLLLNLMTDDSIMATEKVMLSMVAYKLEEKYSTNADAKQLIAILLKDRKILTMELEEIEEFVEQFAEDEAEEGKIEEFLEEFIEKDTKSSVCEINTQKEDEKEFKAPEGLTSWEKLLWRKKHANTSKKVVAVQTTNIPSVTTYTPSPKKIKLGDE